MNFFDIYDIYSWPFVLGFNAQFGIRTQSHTVSKLVTALGRFFRFTLNSGREWISLQQEMEHIQNYLIIQSYRYQHKLFSYQLSIEETIRNNRIMPLILQPLVENAIEHGISKPSETGTISIVACKIGDKVCISIANTGGRLDLEHVKQLLNADHASEHVGLRNVQQRIQR
ncbi:sensor histidine kinase [Paenibacillus planticolens]|uniref:sensor histidine kinase n=1 Tax=Paenibacillus planticolens TaxID=2654976 RepID=UPI0014920FE0|nr:histidine kinase [Paenibacillus planticolens]